jgi:thiol-disulfide isomerase/thioredoxin
MRNNAMVLFLQLLYILPVNTQAQQSSTPTLNIGDPAPPLLVQTWLKGIPLHHFEKGRVYVMEFWATWCGPCIAAMPHLSALARQYKDQVSIVGIDVKEKESRLQRNPKAFVDSMRERMDYRVATEDTNHTVADWLEASGEEGIPVTYVVNQEGRVACIGSPFQLDTVLARVVGNNWDIKVANDRHKEQQRLEALERGLMDTLNYYSRTAGKQDSFLIVINSIVQQEPQLKYARIIGSYTFTALLKKHAKGIRLWQETVGHPRLRWLYRLFRHFWRGGLVLVHQSF